MKTYKFLIIVEDPGFYESEMSDDQWDRVCKTECSGMKVVECIHEEWEDNLVSLGEEENILVKDVDGRLYYWTSMMTKEMIIKGFEQNSTETSE